MLASVPGTQTLPGGGLKSRGEAGCGALAGAALSAVLGAETECVLGEEKGAESKGQLGRCSPSRHTQTPPAGVTGQETVSCVPQVVHTAFYSSPAAALGQAGLRRRGRRQKELGWLPPGTEKVSDSRDTGPETLPQDTLYPEAERRASKFSRPGRSAPVA